MSNISSFKGVVDPTDYATAEQGTDERVPTAAGLTSKFATAKATLVDGDKMAVLDSAAIDVPKHGLLSALWTYIQAKVNAAGGRRVSAMLTADETGDENTITLKTSPTLTLALEVGTWNIEALIIVHGNASFATAGVRQKISFTGTGAFSGSAMYAVDNAASTSAVYPTTRSVTAIDSERLASGNSSATLRMGKLVVTVPGNLVVQYAQRTATAAASPSLAAPSYLRATIANS